MVCSGAPVPDDAWLRGASPYVVPISVADLSAGVLLHGIVRARFGGSLAPVAEAFGDLPPAVVGAFLSAPRRYRRRRDLSVALRLSRGGTQRLTRDLGSARFEHLLAELRAATSNWLVEAGVPRPVVMACLGIEDWSNFTRSCRRAGIPPPRTK